MAKALDFRPHPVQLVQLNFPHFAVDIDEGFGEPPFRFPELRASLESQFFEDSALAVVTLEVESEQYFAAGDKVTAEADEAVAATKKGIETASTPAAVRLQATAVAIFNCHDEFEDKENALRTFLGGDAPGVILWPYVRAFIADLVAKTGLPAYHLPLTQVPLGGGEPQATQPPQNK